MCIEERLLGLGRRLGVCFDVMETDRLIRLDAMLEKWGRAISLTGFKNAERRFERYFAEALYAWRWLPERGRVLDVGSGGGSPALPLAIMNPEIRWTLLEPNRKKAVFLEEASRQLQLTNVGVDRARLEDYSSAMRFEAITVRGVAVEAARLKALSGHLEKGGRLLLFTGEKVAAGMVPQLSSKWEIVQQGSVGVTSAQLLILERGD